MNRYTKLDQIARQFPLGSCVKYNHIDPTYGRVVNWTLHSDGTISLGIVSVPGHYPCNVVPDLMTIIQPSAMPDYKEDHRHA